MDIYFGSVKKVYRPFSTTGAPILLIPGQDFEYALTEVIVRVSGTPEPGILEVWGDQRKILDIPVPASPDPIYVDGEHWTVGKEESVFLRIPDGYSISGRVMFECVTER